MALYKLCTEIKSLTPQLLNLLCTHHTPRKHSDLKYEIKDISEHVWEFLLNSFV